MKVFSVTTKNEAGEHKLDVNKVLELLIRIVAVVGAIIALRASRRGEKQQEFLKYQFSPSYLNEVKQKEAQNQRSK
jgi:hypothetical protein